MKDPYNILGVDKTASDKEIKKGEKFSKQNLWVRRPGTGDFKQEDLKFLYKKKSSKRIAANIQIKKSHIA